MNRQIKFRGVDIHNDNEWRCGSLITTPEGKCAIVCHDKDGVELSYDVIPQTVGQFSGLCDKNHKEIYEGDIITKSDDKRMYLVRFCVGMFYASAGELNENVSGGFPLNYFTDAWESVVAGNIHDNPRRTETKY